MTSRFTDTLSDIINMDGFEIVDPAYINNSYIELFPSDLDYANSNNVIEIPHNLIRYFYDYDMPESDEIANEILRIYDKIDGRRFTLRFELDEEKLHANVLKSLREVKEIFNAA